MYFLPREIRHRPSPQPSDIAQWPGHPLINRLAWSRGVRDAHDLDFSLAGLPHFSGLEGIDQAALIIANALVNQQKIAVVGDYDADGATSTAVMISALSALGAQRIDYFIPDRFSEGYGLKTALAERLFISGYELVITVDNGISSVEAVEYLVGKGISVVITDHHLPPPVLPNASAIVNPRVNQQPFAAPNLAGVGVAFYTLLAVRAELDKLDYFTAHARPNLAHWLDLVALGTIADVVPMDRVNRILVRAGLERIRSHRARAGIAALIRAAKRDAAHLTSIDLAFSIGPTLNAAGRLDDMRIGVRCLLAEDIQSATEGAMAMRGLNTDRKQIEHSMLSQALDQCDNNRAGVVVFGADWHEGVIGLVAARIKERYMKPCIACAATDEAGIIKGSGRSVSGFHLRDILVEVDNMLGNTLISFGGHAAAAGVTLYQRDYDAFADAFDRVVIQHSKAVTSERDVLWSDGPLDLDQMSHHDATMLEEGLPWGAGFEEPRFDGVFQVSDAKAIGADGNHLALTLVGIGAKSPIRAVLFGYSSKKQTDAPDANAMVGAMIRAVYRVSLNRWQGREQLQLMLDYFEPYNAG